MADIKYVIVAVTPGGQPGVLASWAQAEPFHSFDHAEQYLPGLRAKYPRLAFEIQRLVPMHDAVAGDWKP